MKKSVFLLCALALMVFACSEDEPQPEDDQLSVIVAGLGQYAEVSEFVDDLAKLDMTGVDADALTVFAVNNQSFVKAGQLKSTGMDETEMKRHVVAGVYTRDKLKDSLLLEALSGDKLCITVNGENIHVNGVLLGKEVKTGNSVAHIVNSTIPPVTLEPGMVANDTIVASVEKGSSYNSTVNTVKALINFDLTDNDVWVGHEIATANYVNGGFKLILPATVSDQYLARTGDEFEGLHISNPDVKAGAIVIQGYRSGVATKAFSFENYKNDASWAKAEFTYANGDVTITGSESYKEDGVTYKFVYAMSLKRGWNVFYKACSVTGTTLTWEVTTRKVNGLKWYYGLDANCLWF